MQCDYICDLTWLLPYNIDAVPIFVIFPASQLLLINCLLFSLLLQTHAFFSCSFLGLLLSFLWCPLYFVRQTRLLFLPCKTVYIRCNFVEVILMRINGSNWGPIPQLVKVGRAALSLVWLSAWKIFHCILVYTSRIRFFSGLLRHSQISDEGPSFLLETLLPLHYMTILCHLKSTQVLSLWHSQCLLVLLLLNI